MGKSSRAGKERKDREFQTITHCLSLRVSSIYDLISLMICAVSDQDYTALNGEGLYTDGNCVR